MPERGGDLRIASTISDRLPGEVNQPLPRTMDHPAALRESLG